MAKSLTLLAFFLRHFVFGIVAMFIGCVIWTLAYFALLVFAMLTDSGVGSPFAYPAGIIGVIGMVIIFSWGLFAPACGLAAAICHFLKLSRLATLPAAWIIAASISIGLRKLLPATFPDSQASLAAIILTHFVALALPVVLYWSLTEGPWALIAILRKHLKKNTYSRCLPGTAALTPAVPSPPSRAHPSAGNHDPDDET